MSIALKFYDPLIDKFCFENDLLKQNWRTYVLISSIGGCKSTNSIGSRQLLGNLKYTKYWYCECYLRMWFKHNQSQPSYVLFRIFLMAIITMLWKGNA